MLSFGEVEADKELWEYAALVTSLKHEILTLGQLYRDRADCENVFTDANFSRRCASPRLETYPGCKRLERISANLANCRI